MELSSGADIYTGLWVNWSQGAIKGATLTLSSQAGALFTSFIATFIAVAGAQLWKILCFVLHRYRSTAERRDGLHHQRQAILRNSSTPGDTVGLFVKQMFAWSGRVRSPTLRSFLWLLFAVGYLACLAIVSIVGSATIVTAAGGERLVSSNRCGFVMLDLDAQRADIASAERQLRLTQDAAAYSRSCYRRDLGSLSCGLFQTPYIKWKAIRNSSCGFAEDICYPNARAAYGLDSGMMNSNQDLGINTANGETINYRRVTTCSNLERNGYVKTTDLGIFGYHYSDGGEATYEWNFNTRSEDPPYSVFVQTNTVGGGFSTWEPLHALRRTDADVTVVFITRGEIMFFDRYEDPAFEATSRSKDNWTGNNGAVHHYYTPSFHVAPLACADQYQFCNPNNGACTELTGRYAALKGASSKALALSDTQIDVATRIDMASSFVSVGRVINGRSGNALRASERVWSLFQNTLPENQWEVEVEYWFTTGLAALQQQVLEYASGAEVLPAGLVLQPPESGSLSKMCSNQKVRITNQTISFSVLGFTLTFLIGGVVILGSLVIEPLLTAWLTARSRKPLEGRMLAWVLDDKLQLQRLAFEGRGIRTWSENLGTVPVTSSENILPRLSEITLESLEHSRRSILKNVD